MRTKTKNCIDCGSSNIKERRRCGDCALKYNRDRVKERYHVLKERGVKRIRYGEIKCVICGLDMIKNTPSQIAHGKCKKKVLVVDYNKYPVVK